MVQNIAYNNFKRKNDGKKYIFLRYNSFLAIQKLLVIINKGTFTNDLDYRAKLFEKIIDKYGENVKTEGIEEGDFIPKHYRIKLHSINRAKKKRRCRICSLDAWGKNDVLMKKYDVGLLPDYHNEYHIKYVYNKK